MKNLFRKKWFLRPVCTLLMVSHLGVVTYTPYASSASTQQNAQSAEQFYKTLPGLSANSNGTAQYGNGQAVNINQVYPNQDSSTSLDQLKSVYGNDGDTTKLGSKTNTALKSENSLRGEAYRTVTGATKTTANIKNTDSIFGRHKDFLANQEKYMQDLGDCSMSKELHTNRVVQHIPDYKECTRTTSVSGTFNLFHPYEAGLLSHRDGPANIASCGVGCIELWVGTVGDNYWEGRCKIYEEEMSVNIINPQAITSAVITRAKWDDYMQIYIGGTGRESLVWAGPDGPNVFPPETKGKCERNTSWDRSPNVDVTNKFRNTPHNGSLFFKNRVSITGAGEGYAKVMVRYDPSRMVSNDIWESDRPQEFQNLVTAINTGYCQNYSVTCRDSVTPDQNGCAYINGAHICSKDLTPSPIPGLSPFCKSATVVSHCGTDAGVNNTCKSYDNNSACKFIKSTCITGAAGGQSGCWQASEVWDCGTDAVVPSTTEKDKYVCPGAVQCINGTCLQPESEPSGDFQTAVAMLQAATYAVNEMVCGDDTTETTRTCSLFKGEAMQCKSAIGGWVDCCNQPVNVSWIQYLQLTYYTLKVTDALAVKAGMFEQGKGLFDMGSELATKAIDAITKPVMSAFNSLTGRAGTEVAKEITEKGMTGLINEAVGELTKQVAQWTLDTFGPTVTNAIFESTAGTAAVEGGVLANEGVQLSSTLVNAVSVIGYAYMAYQIANILVNIIWACTEDEFKLAVKKETKLAVHIDSWCQTKLLGQCIEKRSSYCTFNSQIGRIFQEQGRRQLGIGWGNKRNPDCRGLTLEEFGRIDFSKVDLSEWIGSLHKADLLPSPDNINLDSVTGSGSILNINGNRKNTRDRFQDGVNSIDIEETKKNVEGILKVQ
ncbi:conjugal transfer mating pair stabilization protein TraN [Photorhabdus luminescens]|uniref:Conjugal transfer protein TraN n=1 Tax=Photorhabdus luminescens subsp. mexicana TaxID=2100167 RepID=A0A4R4IY04_PHOLU|nr:conjugal transfer mating pair stabilization protein TraN [Photorhabdus luminescens]TDB45612.1 conjugal transfer protein TraN [Photorhabdus luminescens subsp. mexicana]